MKRLVENQNGRTKGNARVATCWTKPSWPPAPRRRRRLDARTRKGAQLNGEGLQTSQVNASRRRSTCGAAKLTGQGRCCVLQRDANASRRLDGGACTQKTSRREWLPAPPGNVVFVQAAAAGPSRSTTDGPATAVVARAASTRLRATSRTPTSCAPRRSPRSTRTSSPQPSLECRRGRAAPTSLEPGAAAKINRRASSVGTACRFALHPPPPRPQTKRLRCKQGSSRRRDPSE